MPQSDDHPPPLVITGIGNSGTRVFMWLARAAGCFMGIRINDSGDALELVELADRWCEPVHSAWAEGRPPPEPARFMRELATCVQRHRHGIPGQQAPWGWKQPRSVHLLPLLCEAYPDLRVVHVIRDGRDIAFGRKIHLRISWKPGNPFGVPSALLDRPTPVQAAALWSETNMLVADLGERDLGERYLRVSLESLCADPPGVAHAIERFSVGSDGAISPEQLTELVVTPPTLGRWREEDGAVLAEVTEVAAPALERFGYR